jgi:hypothetical protein
MAKQMDSIGNAPGDYGRIDFSQVFFDDDERVEAVLGRGVIQSLLTGKGISKGALILSQKRLYQKGARFDQKPGGGWVAMKGTSVVDIDDITGTSSVGMSSPVLLFLAIMCLSLALFLGILIKGGFMLSVFVGLLSVVLFIGYATAKRQLFVINYAGGAIGMSAGWFSESEIDKFHRIIAQARERIKDRRSR